MIPYLKANGTFSNSPMSYKKFANIVDGIGSQGSQQKSFSGSDFFQKFDFAQLGNISGIFAPKSAKDFLGSLGSLATSILKAIF